MAKLTHSKNPYWKNLFIRLIIKLYGVNMNEAKHQELSAYASFNDFFTRELLPNARPITTEARAIACPADGVISQIGTINAGMLLQAKGHHYSVQSLLGGSQERAQPFLAGSFATIYLSPKDYHRLHMPLTGVLQEMLHIPGKLFSVNQATVTNVPDLFARNERVVAIFSTDAGPMALILVGAIFVSSIETVWHGVVTPPTISEPRSWQYTEETAITLTKGEEMGRFNMGSTIIVLFAKDNMHWLPDLAADSPVKLGQGIGLQNT